MVQAAMPFNWFDMLISVVLVAGIIRGRKRGMSEELLDVLKWLLVVVVSAMFYRPIGMFVSNFTHFNLLISFVITYLFLCLSIHLVFSALKKAVGEKLVQSDVFGRAEYYLGMLAGALRFSCMLVVALSVLNAKYISPAEAAAEAKLQQDNFGTISFPTVATLQRGVFVESKSGPYIKQYLGDQLIASTAYQGIDPSRSPARRAERMLDEMIGAKKP